MSIVPVGKSLTFVNVEFERNFTALKPDAQILKDPVKAQLEAYNAHQLERFMACFSEDVVFQDGENEVLFRGHKQMHRVYSGVFASKKVTAKVTERIQVGQWTAERQTVKGLGKASSEVLVLYQVQEGLIRHVKLFR